MSNHLVGVAEIADMLAVSRQRVAQLMETYEDFPKPEVELTAGRVWARSAVESWMAMHPERKSGEAKSGGGMFSRFTDRARRVVVHSQEEARKLHHNYIGTEHLLLGLLVEGEGLAAMALHAFGLELQPSRDEVQRMVGVGTAEPQGHIPFTPRAKKVLELSLREALVLGHNYISTEHILLGLLREREGVGAKVIEKSGASADALREKVLELIGGHPSAVAVQSMQPFLNPIIDRLERIEQRLRDIDS